MFWFVFAYFLPLTDGGDSQSALTNENPLDLTHLHRLIGGDEWQHEVETRAAGGGQESPSPAWFTQTDY